MFEVGDWLTITACNTSDTSDTSDKSHNFFIFRHYVVGCHPVRNIRLTHYMSGEFSEWSELSLKRANIIDVVYFKLKESYVQKHMV